METLRIEWYRLDLIAIWNGEHPETVWDLAISLREVPCDRFRFFENHRFIVSA